MLADTAKKPTVLVGMGSYWPGAGANGPIKSLVNLIEALSDTFDFRVVARDRPFDGVAPQPGTETWVWRTDPRGFPVLHIPAPETGIRAMRRVLAETPYDLLYLNGFFDREFSIAALVARRLSAHLRTKPVLIAPRGEFAPVALALKAQRKHAYLSAAGPLGLLRQVSFHATNAQEAVYLKAAMPRSSRIFEAGNIADAPPPTRQRQAKQPGACRLIFSGRIVPIKNLDIALKVLSQVKSRVTYDVCGPMEDTAYWQRCQMLIARLPPNITVNVCGALDAAALRQKLSEADGLMLPTGGENFGHAIVEAMQAGLPVVISDRTPWTGLDREGAGWSLPLQPIEPFITAVEAIAAMDAAAWQVASSRARAYSDRAIQRAPAIDAHRAMFEHTITIKD